jgi:hypothetical protein
VIERPSDVETGGVPARPIVELASPSALPPGGERLDGLRAAAVDLRRRLRDAGSVESVRSVDLLSASLTTQHAFGGAARGGPSPVVSVTSRMVVVRFHDLAGARRLLCWQPSSVEARLPARAGGKPRRGPLPRPVALVEHHGVRAALARCGARAEDVDVVAFGDLQGEDLRTITGTTRAVEGEHEPRRALFPNAHVLCQRRELDLLRRGHPLHAPWYVPRAAEYAVEACIVPLDTGVELGAGVALVGSPGATNGRQALVLATADGLWVVSGNGVAADNWHPHLSKIPGVRRQATELGHEVIATSGGIESTGDQYDAMVMEKAIADPGRLDPRWTNLVPARELTGGRSRWPVTPSYSHGPLADGRVAPERLDLRS